MKPVASAALVEATSSIAIVGSFELMRLVPTLGFRLGTGWLLQSVIATLTGSVEPYFQTLEPSALNGARIPLIEYRCETAPAVLELDPTLPSLSVTVTLITYEPGP